MDIYVPFHPLLSYVFVHEREQLRVDTGDELIGFKSLVSQLLVSGEVTIHSMSSATW